MSLRETLKEFVWNLLKWPLRTLYRKGPRMLYLWEGLSEENICYEMTNIDALFWLSSEDSVVACQELIRRKFEAFVVSVYGVLLVYLAYTLFCIKLYEYVFVSRLALYKTYTDDATRTSRRIAEPDTTCSPSSPRG